MNSKLDVNSDPRRVLPSVDRLTSSILEQNPRIPRWAASEGARQAISALREELSAPRDEASTARAVGGLPDLEDVQRRAFDLALRGARALHLPHPRRVINATGVVLHTNLGRAPLAPGAAEAAARVSAGYSNLELDVESGRRGNRLGALEAKLRLCSGAEAAYACNNNAAAVLLVLNTLAAGREVIVSRGELVEIGGSFRVPEIMRRAGVKLVEVGSTNRTHAHDYEDAINDDTALLLKVHRSNFELRGFVKEVDLASLVEIGRRHGLPVVEDLGSGTLLDLTSRGFPLESFAPGRLREGPDLICFSGDKLLGGPQAGIALGSSVVVDAMRKNPLARALRLDKLTLAALDWTLECILDGRAHEEIPVLRQMLLPASTHEARTRALAKRLAEALPEQRVEISVQRDRVPVGGGSLPGFELDGFVLGISSELGADHLAAKLRSGETPILTRVRDASVLVDLRAVDEADEPIVERALIDAMR